MIDRQPEEEGGDRRSVPERLGGFLYYTRRDEEKAFPVYVRRPVEGKLDDEQVVSTPSDLRHAVRSVIQEAFGVGCSVSRLGAGCLTRMFDRN